MINLKVKMFNYQQEMKIFMSASLWSLPMNFQSPTNLYVFLCEVPTKPTDQYHFPPQTS